MTTSKQVVATTQAPAAIGPYSQAIATVSLVFCSGQLGLDPATGQMVSGGIAAETRQVLENLKAVLAAGGSSFNQVVRTGVYLVDLGDFQTMNAIYAEYFPDCPPARTTIQVSALPRGGRVEIDAIALRG